MSWLFPAGVAITTNDHDGENEKKYTHKYSVVTLSESGVVPPNSAISMALNKVSCVAETVGGEVQGEDHQ